MASDHLPDEITNSPTPSPAPSTPIHLSGFLSGDTIQLQGDTDNLQFSVQFSIHRKQSYSVNQTPSTTDTINPEIPYPFLDIIAREHQNFPSSSSSFRRNTTPITTHDHQEQLEIVDANSNEFELAPTIQEASDEARKGSVLTRLRSGVLTPVNYYPPPALGSTRRSWRKGGSRKRGDVLERVLRQHSFPIRPCSSYSFFVMSNWDVVESSSFGEKSKRLGEMWCRLSQNQKQIFEEMAFKDSARYKKQCMLLAEEEI